MKRLILIRYAVPAKVSLDRGLSVDFLAVVVVIYLEEKKMSKRNEHGFICSGDCDYCQADVLGCNIRKEQIEEMKKYDVMNYCEFRKCHWGDRRYDLGGCGIAGSGETCYSLYPDSLVRSVIAYKIHLEEVKLNNE